MANKKVTLIRRCKTPDGWRQYPVVYGNKGKLKPGFVLVGGIERHYPEGYYALRSYVGNKIVYERLTDHASDALDARNRATNLVVAKTAAVAAGVQIVEEPGRKSLQGEFKRFLQAAADRGSMEAVEAYKLAGEGFLRVIGKTFADEVTAEDMLIFQRELRKQEYAQRTIHNRYANVVAFLRYCKLNVKELAPVRPRYEKKLPERYTPAELIPFFASITNPHLYLTFRILLETGLREQEAIYLCWENIDLEGGMLQVRSKPEYGFKIKDKEERDIPIPPDLLKRLRAYRKTHPNDRLVTGTRTDKPNMKLLRTLKRLVNTAGLNCQRCEGCKERKECERWWLHKFRATYITGLLQGGADPNHKGMDLRTVMKLSGHSDLASVMRYMAPAEDEAIKAQLAGMKWM